MTQQERPESTVDDELHIETPVIDIQDLEHNPGPATRVSNKGVKIEPTLGSRGCVSRRCAAQRAMRERMASGSSRSRRMRKSSSR